MSHTSMLRGKERHLAVLIIDMQDGLVSKLAPIEYESLLRCQLQLIEVCGQFNIPVIMLELDCNRFGKTVSVLKEAAIKYLKILVSLEKDENSAFSVMQLEDILKAMGVNTLILSGINASFCVLATARAAFRLGFNVIVDECLIADHEVYEGRRKSLVFFRQVVAQPILHSESVDTHWFWNHLNFAYRKFKAWR